jgi:hypothetical protein
MKSVYWTIGNKYAETAKVGLRLTRWSTGAFVATWAFHGVNTGTNAGDGLFASLNRDARDSLACLALVPAILPLLAMLASVVIVYGGLYTAAREVFVGPEDHPLHLDPQRGVEVNLQMARLSRGWRMWMRWGWWLLAAAAGAVTVLVTGVLLRSSWPSWLVWTFTAASVWAVLQVETLVTSARYQENVADRLPKPEQITERRLEWEASHPFDLSAMPLIYAYSGLSTDEIEARFKKLGTSGMLALTAKVLGFVVIVLTYSQLPAPSVERFRADGLFGCFFANLHGFAGVAKENLGLSIVAGLVLLVLVPFSVLMAYRKFMVEYRFPFPVMGEVLRRESGFARRMWVYTVLGTTIMGVALALVLWLSAVVADHWNSPLGGAVVVTVPAVALVAMEPPEAGWMSQ